jgi:formylglycine-generating enzyme required for sulfatase activity
VLGSNRGGPDELQRGIKSAAKEISFDVGKATFVLRRVPPGTFMLGSPARDKLADEDEMPQRRIKISKAVYLGKTEVTQIQFREVVGVHYNRFEGDELPVDEVMYSEAINFCRRLSKLAGVRVTLPTEAQWEYACRAGATTRYHSGDDERDLERIAWFDKNSGGKTHKVGTKEPNAFGLYDMLGNVAEPCIDVLPPYKSVKETDPRGSENNSVGMTRGGFWASRARYCRAADRTLSNDTFGGMGIRIAINSEDQAVHDNAKTQKKTGK